MNYSIDEKTAKDIDEVLRNASFSIEKALSISYILYKLSLEDTDDDEKVAIYSYIIKKSFEYGYYVWYVDLDNINFEEDGPDYFITKKVNKITAARYIDDWVNQYDGGSMESLENIKKHIYQIDENATIIN